VFLIQQKLENFEAEEEKKARRNLNHCANKLKNVSDKEFHNRVIQFQQTERESNKERASDIERERNPSQSSINA